MNELEFNKYCIKYQDYIYVREQIAGKWKSVSLGSLPIMKKQEWIDKWFEKNQMPVRLKTPKELEEQEGIGLL